MPEDMLRMLVNSASRRVLKGYYETSHKRFHDKRSITGRLKQKGSLPIIAEIKYSSPSSGYFGCKSSPEELAKIYQEGGAIAVSVLTDPDYFAGSLDHIFQIRKSSYLPILMKDFIIDKRQIAAADNYGADAVLLITSIFSDGYIHADISEFIDFAHTLGLEVIQEVHSYEEYLNAVKGNADIIGINNRNLRTMKVSLEISSSILRHKAEGKPVVCESGFTQREELLELRRKGADGFLIGSAFMRAVNPAIALADLIGE